MCFFCSFGFADGIEARSGDSVVTSFAEKSTKRKTNDKDIIKEAIFSRCSAVDDDFFFSLLHFFFYCSNLMLFDRCARQLDNNAVMHLDDISLAQLKSLRALRLVGNMMERVPTKALTGLPTLEIL